MSKNQSWLMTVSMIVLALAAVFAVVKFIADPTDGVVYTEDVNYQPPAHEYRPVFPVN